MVPLTAKERYALSSAVTQFDIKQSKRKHYNRYALAQYLAAVENASNAINCGTTRREALIQYFNGRLLDVCLKALNMEPSTKQEQMGL
jgi:hypothetical protein